MPKDENDPEGLKLLGAPDRLAHAAKILRPLETLVDTPDVWAAVYDIAIRRRAFVLSGVLEC